MSVASVQPARLSVKERLENQAIGPLFLVLIVSFMTRSAQTWSFGAFTLAMLPLGIRHAIDAITGLGMAASLEILSSAAGAKWFKCMDEEIAMRYNSNLSRQERESQAHIISVHKWTNLIFMLIGALSSMGAGLYFAISETGNSSVGGVLFDMLVVVVLTAAVLYFGIVYEPAKPDKEKIALERLEDQVATIFESIVDKVRGGTFTNQDINALQAQLPKHKQVRLDALKVFDGSVETWDTARITKALGKADDPDGQRDIRRRIQAASKDPGLKLHKNGNKWVVPLTSVMVIFKEDIERLLVTDNQRHHTTEYGNENAENSRNGARQSGQSPDIGRSEAMPDTVPA